MSDGAIEILVGISGVLTLCELLGLCPAPLFLECFIDGFNPRQVVGCHDAGLVGAVLDRLTSCFNRYYASTANRLDCVALQLRILVCLIERPYACADTICQLSVDVRTRFSHDDVAVHRSEEAAEQDLESMHEKAFAITPCIQKEILVRSSLGQMGAVVTSTTSSKMKFQEFGPKKL